MPNYKERRERLIEKMCEMGIDTIVLAPGPDMTYLTGFREEQSDRPIFLLVGDGCWLIAPDIYEGQLDTLDPDIEIGIWKEGDPKNSFDLLKSRLKGKTAIDDRMFFSSFFRMANEFKGGHIYEPASPLIKDMRIIKDPDEIETLRRAGRIASDSLRVVWEKIEDGKFEVEIAAEIEYEMRGRGAASLAFETIATSGPRSAMPHARASSETIKTNLVLDFGCFYENYASDMTRTFLLGHDEELERIYGIVKEAQARAVQSVKDGVKAKEVDQAARSYIEKRGYGDYFYHRTGHGIGLEVHERPYITKDSEVVLKEGMAFSVEPGIYLPGRYGVRIEDIVIVTESGCEVLNDFPREMVFL